MNTATPSPSTRSSSRSRKNGAPAATVAPFPSSTAPQSVDDLLRYDAETLGALYASASVPTIGDLDGDFRGRMLAIPKASPLLNGWARGLASQGWFPWKGKSFHPLTDARGEGINRVFTDTNRWFRFETFVGPSRAGSFDAVQLDYDNPSNPFFIRAIKDEIRELRTGLYLGQAYLLISDQTHLALYFGLQNPKHAG